MATFKAKRYIHKLTIIKSGESNRKIVFCKAPPEIINHDLVTEQSSSLKAESISNLIKNIYVYKSPPVMYWPDGLGMYFDIPVDYVIVMRKILEHFSQLALENIKEICFSTNNDYSSYTDKTIIIPVDYVVGRHDKALFLDVFSHEVAHSLLVTLEKDEIFRAKFRSYYKTIAYYSRKYGCSLFFDPGVSDKDLANYQLEDYKEFFAELSSQILNYYHILIRHICSIQYEEASEAYIESINLLLNYIIPFIPRERQELIMNLI